MFRAGDSASAGFGYVSNLFPEQGLNRQCVCSTYGHSAAQAVVCAGIAVGAPLSVFSSSPRIALASAVAFAASQLTDIKMFHRLRHRSWYVCVRVCECERGRESGPGGLTREVDTPLDSNHPRMRRAAIPVGNPYHATLHSAKTAWDTADVRPRRRLTNLARVGPWFRYIAPMVSNSLASVVDTTVFMRWVSPSSCRVLPSP